MTVNSLYSRAYSFIPLLVLEDPHRFAFSFVKIVKLLQSFENPIGPSPPIEKRSIFVAIVVYKHVLLWYGLDCLGAC